MLWVPLRWLLAVTAPSFPCWLASPLLLLALFAAPAQAWWDVGHHAICQRAIELVLPATRARLNQMGKESLDCAWADQVKRKRPDTRPWHYLNAPPGTFDISLVQRPAVGDLISALTTQVEQLKSAPDAKSRVEALRWVGHLVGDLHQPMHLGYADDLGGNTYRLALPQDLAERLNEERDTVSMHAVWDGLIQRHGRITLKAGETPETASTAVTDPRAQIIGWANDTLALLNDPAVAYRLETRISTLTSSYLHAQTPVVASQLEKAAGRLARLLDWALEAH